MASLSLIRRILGKLQCLCTGPKTDFGHLAITNGDLAFEERQIPVASSRLEIANAGETMASSPLTFPLVHSHPPKIQHFNLPALLLGSVLIFSMTGCSAPKKIIVDPTKTPAQVYESEPVSVLTGKASFYYGRWIGRKTANGEIYRAGDVTAAHKSLPFNTMVRVTNLNNGKSVIVRINNRGPFIKGRILDLSLVAAQRIDMTKAGVVPVRAEILKKIPVVPKPTAKLPPSKIKPKADPTPSVKPSPTPTPKPTSKPTPTKKTA